MFTTDWSQWVDTGDACKRTSVPASVPSRKRGVLVVDDTRMICNMLEVALCERGLEVWQALNAGAAVALIRVFRDRIDLVLLDVQMPGGDGPEALAAIRNVAPEVKCCFMTGDPAPYTEADLLDLGAERVFAKPFRVREVSRVVDTLILDGGRPATADASPWLNAASWEMPYSTADAPTTPP